MPLKAASAAVTDLARDWISLAFVGLGISFSKLEYTGGLFLAVAAASLIARRRNDPRKLWSVIATAAFAATIAAIYGIGTNSDFAPPQIVMMVVGVTSGAVMQIVIKLLDRVEARSGEIADRLIDSKLPPQDPH